MAKTTQLGLLALPAAIRAGSFAGKAAGVAWFKIALEEHKPVFTDATFTDFGLDAEEMHRYMYMMS